MKTTPATSSEPKNRVSAGRLAFLGALTGLSLLTGCIVTSVYPFYTDAEVEFAPALVGRWTNAAPAAGGESLTFAPAGANAYRVTYASGDKTTVLEAHRFKLAGQIFLDLAGVESQDREEIVPAIPAHSVVRLLATQPSLRMSGLDYDWLTTWLEKHPKALRHHLVTQANGSGGRLVLTAGTRELQQFLLEHLPTADAWTQTSEFRRDPAGPAATRRK